MRASTVHFASSAASFQKLLSTGVTFLAERLFQLTSELHFCRRACGVSDQQLWQKHSVAVMSKLYVAGARQLDLDMRAAAESVRLEGNSRLQHHLHFCYIFAGSCCVGLPKAYIVFIAADFMHMQVCQQGLGTCKEAPH